MRDCESVIIGFVLVRFRLLCSLYAQAQLVTDWSPFCTVRRAVEWRRSLRVALDRACVCCCTKPSRGDAGRFRFAALNARRARQASAMTRGAQRQMKVSCSSRSAAAVGRTNDEHTLSRGTTCTPHRHQNHQRSTPTRVPRARSAERRRRCPLNAKMPECQLPATCLPSPSFDGRGTALARGEQNKRRQPTMCCFDLP